jgi:hypothetical protein
MGGFPGLAEMKEGIGKWFSNLLVAKVGELKWKFE